MNGDVLKRLREQAAIQLETTEGAERPAFRVRPADQQVGGLALLPAPDAGDIWFDMEGFPDPISGEKLDYLFGASYRDEAGDLQFKAWWAHTTAEEKGAFDGFISWVQRRRQKFPNLHVYHYASYEKTALGNLAARHQLHQPLWDQFLREELFVDLYPIVRRGLGSKEVKRVYRTRDVSAASADATVDKPVDAAARDRFCLSDAEVLQLARFAATIEAHYSARAGEWRPMDVEFAKDGTTGANCWSSGLQPVKKMARMPNVDGAVAPATSTEMRTDTDCSGSGPW